jgi:hypothetical protein
LFSTKLSLFFSFKTVVVFAVHALQTVFVLCIPLNVYKFGLRTLSLGLLTLYVMSTDEVARLFELYLAKNKQISPKSLSYKNDENFPFFYVEYSKKNEPSRKFLLPIQALRKLES